MAAVEFKAITKAFGATTVLHAIDVEIGDGQFVVILGPSGCGKSTLLRILAGLEPQSTGDVLIGDRIVNAVEPKDRDIAMVFQNYALYPHMSVFDNMAYGLRARGMGKPEIAQRVAKAATTLALEGLLDRRPRQLSGGQRQRVAMGRAIVREPAVFLFDEPLSNLDAKLRVAMRLEMKTLHRALRTTSVYVTHDQVEAMTLADRLIVMNGGRIEQSGAPMEVYERPASVFVATFLGAPAMNILPAQPLLDSSALATLVGEARWPMPAKSLLIGIRPEHLVVREVDGAGTLPLTVDLVESLGADRLVHGSLPSSANAAPARLTLRVPGDAPIAEGRRLAVTADAVHVHVFDADSGRRLA